MHRGVESTIVSWRLKRPDMIRGPTFSVVIRTWGRPRQLSSCLHSLEGQTERPSEVIVVQAGVAHQSPEHLDHIRLVTLQQQGRGISNAANEGIARASGDIIAFIDDDALPSANWIEALKRRYVAEPSIAGVGGLVIDSRTNEIWFNRGVVDVFGYAYMRPEKARPAYPVFPYLTGCNMSFQRKVLEDFGGFDQFYVYSYEETDLCIRIQQAGLRIAFEPNAVVWHSYAPGPTRRHVAFNSEKSRIYFSLSNFDLPLRQLVAHTLLRLGREAVGLALQTIRGRSEAVLAMSQFVETIVGAVVGFLFGVRAKIHRTGRLLS
jgi:GT2 family glycosyltransferase